MKATSQPCYTALEEFKKAQKEATQKYAASWQEFFKLYGFNPVPTKYHYDGSFAMTWGGINFEFFCHPSHYQGVKIMETGPKGITHWHKVMTNNGAENWMRNNGFGKPPI